MTYVGVLTFAHTAVSLVAIGVGIPAVLSLFARASSSWRAPFIATALLTTGSGFIFPFTGPTPAFLVGIVAALVLLAVLLAERRTDGSRLARRIYAGGMVASLYLLVFVLIAQAFQKVPALARLAPTGTEPAFAVAQIIALLVFAYAGVRAVRLPGPVVSPPAR